MLCDLPTEVLDHVAEYLSDPSDLLRLALVNSLMRDIVLPDHLDYTKIWTDNFNESLWRGLNAKRAARVRELRVNCMTIYDYDTWENEHDEDEWEGRAIDAMIAEEALPYRIRADVSQKMYLSSTPGFCIDCKENTGASVPSWVVPMCTALSTMTGLRKLVICAALCDLARLSSGGFFQNLRRDLDDLEIRTSPCRKGNVNTDSEVLGPALQDGFSGLHGGYSRFAFHWGYDDDDPPIQTPIAFSNVLSAISCVVHERCPDLCALELRVAGYLGGGWPGHDCRDFLRGRWKGLTSLSLHGVRFWSFPGAGEAAVEDNIGSVAAFLRYHRRLEVLRFRITEAYLPDLSALRPDYVLPALRDLHLDRWGVHLLVHLVDSSALGELRPLEVLTIGLLEGPNAADGAVPEAVDCICRHGRLSGSIRKLTYCRSSYYPSRNGAWLRLIGQSNPSITDLSVDPVALCYNKEAFLAIVLSFPNLEILGLSRGDDVKFFGRSKVDLLPGLIEALPKLRKIDEFVKQSDGVWVHQVTKGTVELR